MRTDGGQSWFEQEPGPLVRPFALTRGRAGSDRHALDLITLLLTVRPLSEAAKLDREYIEIVRMCQERPLSVAEIASRMNMLMVVVKVLISDLIDEGFLVRRTPLRNSDRPSLDIMQKVLDGLCRL